MNVRLPPTAIESLPARLWERAAAAPRRLMLLDYDGTLAPFRVQREEAVPLPAARAALERVARSRRTAAGVVSGRPVSELRRLLGDLPLRLVGEHGWEEWNAADGVRAHPVPGAAAEGLREAEAAARGVAHLLERKRCSLVLHTRGLAPGEALAIEAACQERWAGLTAKGCLRLERMDGGLELRAIGRDKGSAVRGILTGAGAAVFPVYIGDDATDEDAFEAVAATGLGLRVGSCDRPTRAEGRLPACAAVAEFLDHWWWRIEGGLIAPAGTS